MTDINRRRPVLDGGYVQLDSLFGGDAGIASFARVAHGSKAKDPDADRRLIASLMRKKHGSVFEACIFRFDVRAPVMVLRQWQRHRIGSFMELSRRYVTITEDDFYIPESWRDENYMNPGTPVIDYEDSLHYHMARSVRRGLVSYNYAIARGIKKERARLLLNGYAVYGNMTWIVNVRSLINFLTQRTHKSAQWEIRQYAAVLEDIFSEVAPWTHAAWLESRKGS